MKAENKEVVEFDLNALFGLAILIGITALACAYLLSSMADVKSDFVTDTAGCNSTDTSSCGIGYNATESGMEAVAKIPTKLPLIVGIVLIVVIIGLFKKFGDAN